MAFNLEAELIGLGVHAEVAELLGSTSGGAIGGAVKDGIEGSVLFVGAGEVLSQDNSSFFWNDSTKGLILGAATNTLPALTLRGGATGTSLLSLQRTSGTTITYEFSLAGAGLGLRDITSGDYLTANFFGDASSNQLYIGQRGKTLAEATPRPSYLAGTTFSGVTDQAPGSLILIAGLGTGNTSPSTIQFYGHIAANGASGTTPQVAAPLGRIGRQATNYSGIWLADNFSATSYALAAGNATSGDTNTYVNGTNGVVFNQANVAYAKIGALGLNLGANSTPTHGLTIQNIFKAAAIGIYNTTDQTTNYERFHINWTSNILELGMVFGGTGTSRSVQLGVSPTAGAAVNTYFRVSPNAPFFTFSRGSSSTGTGFINLSDGVGGLNFAASSGNQIALDLNPTGAQTSTAGYSILKVNPTGTFGTGTKLLLELQEAGTTRVSVSNTGFITLANQTTTVGASAGTLTNCPAVGNPTGYLQVSINGVTGKIPYWV